MSVPLTKLPPTNLQRGEPQVRWQQEEARQAFPNPFASLIFSIAGAPRAGVLSWGQGGEHIMAQPSLHPTC